MNCEMCGSNIDMLTTRWVRVDIVVDDDGDLCQKTTSYCVYCVTEKYNTI